MATFIREQDDSQEKIAYTVSPTEKKVLAQNLSMLNPDDPNARRIRSILQTYNKRSKGKKTAGKKPGQITIGDEKRMNFDIRQQHQDAPDEFSSHVLDIIAEPAHQGAQRERARNSNKVNAVKPPSKPSIKKPKAPNTEVKPAKPINEKKYYINTDIENDQNYIYPVKISVDEFEKKLSDIYSKYYSDGKPSAKTFIHKFCSYESEANRCKELKKLAKDLKTVEADGENCDMIGKIRTIKNGIPYAIVRKGGDWEIPVLFMVYYDGENIRAYFPKKGNSINLDKMRALDPLSGSENDDLKYVKKFYPNEKDIQKILDSIHYDENLCIKDFGDHIKTNKKRKITESVNIDKKTVIITEEQLNRLNKILLKEYYKGDLYHSTTLSHLYSILKENCIYTNEDCDDVYGTKGTFVSLSRTGNPKLCFKKTSIPCVICIDAEKLMLRTRNAKLKPFNFFHNDSNISKHKHFEFEERFYGDIHHLSGLIKSIDIYVEDINKMDYDYCDDTEYAYEDLQNNGIEATDKNINMWFIEHIMNDFPLFKDRIKIHGQIMTEDRIAKNMHQARTFIRNSDINEEPQKYIEKVRNFLPNSRLNNCHFLLGCVRVFPELWSGAANRNWFNKALELINRDYFDDFDSNLNDLSATEIIEELKDEILDELRSNSLKVNNHEYYKNHRYKIVPILTFEEAEKYRSLTEWCVCDEEEQFDIYGNDGTTLYFCLRDDYLTVKQEEGENFPWDDYGLSMIAVSVHNYDSDWYDAGGAEAITSRWNAFNEDSDDYNHVLGEEELSQILGVNFYEVFKPIEKHRKKIFKNN